MSAPLLDPEIRRSPEFIEKLKTVPPADLASEYGVSASLVHSWRQRSGVSEDRKVFTAEADERLRTLAAEGVPASWIAEDIGYYVGTVRKRLADLNLPDDEWVKIQLSIRKTARLAPLHEEFRPKNRKG
ncbi:hypothetical protein ACI7YT_12345 [Microbacterium sp. M]|uniref:hypothetical protein n=1 Tax=Microbacterium sp. M TaxID=3377125 RepID=UPI003868BAC7